jgi:hypothetical protein
LNNIDENGNYFFTTEKNLILSFSLYYLRPVEIEIDFQKDDQMVLLAKIPYEPKWITYIAKKLK